MSAGRQGEAENIHASAVVIGESGVLIRGRSGSGKSALALALLDAARECGLFGALIGDDRVFLKESSGRLLLRGAPEIRSLIERRGFGVEKQPVERTAVARLVVDLLDEGEAVARVPEAADETSTLRGVQLPRLVFHHSSRPFERARAVLAAFAAWTTGL